MTIIKVLGSLIGILLAVNGTFAAGSGEDTRLFPFPMVEVEQIIGRWLTSGGYQTQRFDAGAGEMALKAQKDSEIWRIHLKPSSPLYTEVSARWEGAGLVDAAKVAVLWAFLDRYAKGDRLEASATAVSAPKAVAQQQEAIVCMENSPGGESLQLTGFVYEEEGLVLSTAHDLKDHMTLTLISSNGRRYPGKIIKVDPVRDLAIIQTSFRPSVTVSLARARLSLKLGDGVYAVGCPQGHMGALYMGVVDSPPRLANALPLWQVSLKVLPGSSGSPVFDAEGSLVGIIKGRYRGTDTVGFLIPVSTVREFVGR